MRRYNNSGREKSKAQSIIETVFTAAVGRLAQEGRVVNCLFVQVDVSNGELQVYADADTLLENNLIFDWAPRESHGNGAPRVEQQPYRRPIAAMKTALQALDRKKFFENQAFELPCKVCLTDENFQEVDVLYRVEESSVAFQESERLMNHLDKELSEFYKQLMEC